MRALVLCLVVFGCAGENAQSWPTPECDTNADCKGDLRVCDVINNRCIECDATDNSACGPDAPVCFGGTCRECVIDADCLTGVCTAFGACI